MKFKRVPLIISADVLVQTLSLSGSKFSPGEVTSFLVVNGNQKVLSRQNQYAILEAVAPGTITNFEDNEIQLLQESETV